MRDLGRTLKGLVGQHYHGRPGTSSDIGEEVRTVMEAPFFIEQMQLAALAQQLLDPREDKTVIRESAILVLLTVIRKSWGSLELAEAGDTLVARECERFELDPRGVQDIYGAVLVVAERPAPKQ